MKLFLIGTKVYNYIIYYSLINITTRIVYKINSLTEPPTTKHGTTEPRKTELRMTEPLITEPRKTERQMTTYQKGPNAKRLKKSETAHQK
jgi:hypothetical protein